MEYPHPPTAMTKHSLILHLFSVLLILTGIQQQALAQPIDSMGEAINQAGRQRMLTQRIVKSYCQMGQDVRYLVASQDLDSAITLFEQQLERLKQFAHAPATRKTLDEVTRLWAPVKVIATADVSRDQAPQLRAQAEKLLAAAHRVVLQLEAQSGTNKGHLVNIAGRQRMLSQRMGNLYMLMSWGFDDPQYRADFDQAVEEFEDALEELRAAAENTTEIDRALKKVAQNWDMFKLGNRMEKGEYVPSLVARMLDKILVQMNQITGMYAALPNTK
jgi:nitrate/nitrite-specific signal transduction histidine kinase